MLHSFHLSSSISTHAPLARRDSVISQVVYSVFNFYSRASCEARPKTRQGNYEKVLYFYSRASCEARHVAPLLPYDSPGNFSSRASCEARPKSTVSFLIVSLFLLTRLLRGATLTVLTLAPVSFISTHAPLARRDQALSGY